MKKLFKLAVKILLICVLLVAIGLITLRLMFPREKLKQMAISYAATHLHREISFDKVSFNLIGFTLNNFAMSEDSTFKQGTFIKATRVEAKAAWKPLLKKRIEIAAIYLDGVEVNIQKNQDGSFNFDSLVSSTQEQPAADTPSSENTSDDFVFTAQHIKATDCDFFYTDKQTGLTTGIEDLNFQLDNVDFTKPFPMQISFVSHTQDGTGLTISIPVNIALDLFLAGLDMKESYADITTATASYNNLQLALQGKIANFTSPDVNVTGKITGLNNTVLADVLPDLPNFSLPAITLTLQAAADLDTSTAQIKQAALQILDSELATNGQVGWGGPTTTYQLSGKLKANIAQIVKMTDDTGFDPKGNLSGTFSASDKKDGHDVSGTLTLKNVSALYPPFTLTQTNGTIKITSLDDISCPSLTGQLNGEKFDSSFSYKARKNVTDIGLKLNLDKLTLTEFPASSTDEKPADTPAAQNTPAPETYYNVTADITVGPVSIPYFRTNGVTAQAALTNLSDSMQKANGTVSFSLQPGAITEMDTLIKQSKIARIILLPLNILNAVGKKLNLNLFEAETQAKKGEITMTNAEGKYTFTNGIMTLDTTKFESSLTNLNATGTVNFVTRALDMKASATLVTKQTPVVIKIGGTIDEPSGKLDVVNTVTSVVGGILSYKTAKGAVTGTAGAAKSVSSTAVKDTAQVTKDTVKAIGSLFKKKSTDKSE